MDEVGNSSEFAWYIIEEDDKYKELQLRIDMMHFKCLFFTLLWCSSATGQWQDVYTQSFDQLTTGVKTASKELPQWEGGSASGAVFDGKSKDVGKFLIASSVWTSFNQGPIFNLNLSAVPHDRVRVRFHLYTFGDWRGLQQATGGPQHRLMFFDGKANPRFAFDTNFSTNAKFEQSWPQRNPARNKALRGAKPITVDTTERFSNAHRWLVEFEYPSDSSSLRFTMLCGAAAGSGKRMPHFGVDNVRVSVRSTAPTIALAERITNPPPQAKPTGGRISFQLKKEVTRVSLGIFDRTSGRLIRTLLRGESLATGNHEVFWDGLDQRGQAVAAGNYQWRLLATPGFTAKYLTTIGINPPGGENPVPRRSWVGDHVGAGIVDVDESGVYVGSPMTEGMMMLAKIDAAHSRSDVPARSEALTTPRVVWTREQFYQSGRLTRAAASGRAVLMLHPNGKLRRLNKDNGRVEAEWQVGTGGAAPIDVDASGKNLVVADREENRIRWLSTENGKTIADLAIPNPNAVAAIGETEKSEVAVASGKDVYIASPNRALRKVATLRGSISAMDYDPNRKELWAVVNGHQVVRLNERFKVAQTYSDQPRELGPFDPTKFADVYDIAADLKGGFYVGEPGHPPRRIAHIASDGSLVNQWFGGMAFYVGGAFDPADPSRFYGIAPEGFVNVYKIDYEKASWTIEACYATGRLGDSMFPFAGAYKAVRRNGQTYLYHRVIPAVLRLDAKQRKAIPVAIAGRVINRGRTFFQFAGSGRDGYPKPWVAAAEHYGYRDLKKAPGLYSWADANGNGKFEPTEFRFYPNAKRGLSFHNPGDFTVAGDYIGSANTNEPHALVRLPVAGWEGPDKAAPRWDWDKLQTVGEVIANSYGYGSPRGVSVGPDGSVSVAYQAGIMIREHGEYEGGGWPEAALRGARILSFDAKLQPKFAVGRQSKRTAEANTGVLYYPMQTTFGPNRSVIVNDQTKQPAQVWTHDGLYAGGLFDHRADDGLADGFYRIHGDDNQGATIVTNSDDKTYWLMPYQGHNRLYEIRGWSDWHRQTGDVASPGPPKTTSKGTGLTARYYQGRKVVLETTEAPINYERFGAERHSTKVTPHYKVVWTGSLAPPLTDRYQFSSLLGKAEQVAVWLDGHLVHANGFSAKKNVSQPVDLAAGNRHWVRIEYINPDGRAELKLLWSSRVLDPSPLPQGVLYPDK